MNIALVPVSTEMIRADVLWFLLEEREPHVNISHKKMPSWDEHVAFVDSDPYREWWFIVEAEPADRRRASDSGTFFGACYVTRQNEIGIQIFKKHQRKGYASAALKQIIDRYKGRRLLANISPANDVSMRLFREHGFSLVQYTFELESST